jgi:hypothetical protein
VKKHKTKSVSYSFLHFLFLFLGIILLISAIPKPWAYGRTAMGLINKSVYAYNEPALFLPFFILCVLILIAVFLGFCSFTRRNNFIIPGCIFFAGLITLVLGCYLWTKIETKGICLLVEIHHDKGILFLVIGGVSLAIAGLLGFR